MDRIDEYVYSILPSEGTLLYVGIGMNPEHQFIGDLIKKGYKITVLEIYGPYIPIAKEYLDNKYPNNNISWVTGDVREVDKIFEKSFDIIAWSHGPEHINKGELKPTLDKLIKLVRKHVFINCPYGKYEQGALQGNEYEVHRSTLYPEDFDGFTTETFGDKDSKGSLIAYYDKWQVKQGRELAFWKENVNDKDYEKWYRHTYAEIEMFLGKVGYNFTVLDIGCGAYSFVTRFPFKDIYLEDPLIFEYKEMKNNLDDHKAIVFPAELIEFPDDSIDITFALNCLDHMDSQGLDKTLKKINNYTKQYIVIAVDTKDTPDEYHYKFDTDLYPYFSNKFCLIKDIEYLRGDTKFPVKGIIQIYKRGQGDCLKEHREYWWDDAHLGYLK